MKLNVVRMSAWFVFITLGLSSLNASANIGEKLNFKGNFSIRKEYQVYENQKNRHRNRFRGQVSILPKIADGWFIGFGLGTGSGAPTSAFQSFDNAFSQKVFYLDLAYLRKEFSFLEGSFFQAGKHPFEYFKAGRSEMLFDNDVNPEGWTWAYLPKKDSLSLFFVLGGYWIEEREFAADTFLYSAQLGLKSSFIQFAAAVYFFSKLQGFNTLYSTTESFGNSIGSSGGTLTYQSDYHLINAGVEMDIAFPLKRLYPYVDFVFNTAAASKRMGILAGFQWGKLKEPGDWFLKFQYRFLQADATVGALSASHWGSYRTDTKGFQIILKGRLVKALDLRANYINYVFGSGSSISNQVFMMDASYRF